MLYIGHFWYRGSEPEYEAQPEEGGWFTLLAESDSVAEAGAKFHDLLHSLKVWFSGFNDVAEVYEVSIIEVRVLPEAGVLAHLEKGRDVFETINISLPSVSPEFCTAYRPEKGPPDEAGWQDGDPFVVFED